ncbi:EAL domain-containing protein [Antarcticirhabdus aurantiaca]|uniref:EAL domain-containing protein n=1 Tax=Antarcticirhabdus aurantiaca TaxID=2606717 RepID=A0ACD4NRY3_9HYPH|nr:EAL domain-containing protein [Antarcticirhabdus aurantiaca]WAJ29492.1 EAL domain-containing protein [Jeongeuplla avenae]
MISHADRTSHGQTRFAVALDCAELGVWDADLVNNACYYSPSWKRMLGYGDDELRDHPDLWLDFIHPDDRERALASGDSHLEGEAESVECEFRLRHRSGRWIWVLDRGKVVERNAAGRPTRMIGVQTDITAQKEAAARLALLNQRIELALDASGIGLWSYETETGRTSWDARMREIYGLGPGPEEVPQGTWHARLHPDDAAAAEAAASALLAEGTPVRMTYRILRPDGAVRHIFALSRLVHPPHQPPLVVGSIWDVSEQVEVSDKLAAEKERLRVILRSIGDAVIATDAEDAITFANPAAERLLLAEQADLLGRRTADVLPLRQERTGVLLPPSAPLACAERRTTERDEPALFERRDGERRVMRDTASPLYDAAGAVVGTVLIVQDVTREQARQRELAHLARHDGLTDLLNRSSFDKALARAVEDPAKRAGLALLYVDLDRFKMVNDTAGHAAGDALLKLVAKAMAAVLPAGAKIARLGGDEFAVLMEASGPDAAYRAGGDVVKAVGSQQLSWGGRVHGVGASVGIVLLADAGPDPLTALSLADAACYASKSRGRNKVSLHDPAGGAAAGGFAEVRAASELLQALKENRLRLFGQEIRDLSDPARRSRRIEVLARLAGVDGSLIMPGTFIPAAERFDLMGVLDRRVIRQSLDILAGLRPASEAPVLSINLSAMSLSDPELWSFVEAQLGETGQPAERLCFEITETAAVNNFAAAERFVRDARRAGCRVSLDDFGAGLSSFGYLRRFPVDGIKIDGAFVQDVARNGLDQAICAAVGTIARELGVEVVAERVPDAEGVELLRARGIGFGQRLYLHRPEPLAWLLDRVGAAARRLG